MLFLWVGHVVVPSGYSKGGVDRDGLPCLSCRCSLFIISGVGDLSSPKGLMSAIAGKTRLAIYLLPQRRMASPGNVVLNSTFWGPKHCQKGRRDASCQMHKRRLHFPSKRLLQFVIRIMDCVLAAGHGQLKAAKGSIGSTGSKGLSVDYSRGGGGEGPENGSAHAPAGRRHCGLLCRRSRNHPPPLHYLIWSNQFLLNLTTDQNVQLSSMPADQSTSISR